MDEGESKLQNYLRSLTGSADRREGEINISLTPQASLRLKQLVTRPNPTLAEFPFLGLGDQGVIDEVIAPKKYSSESGLFHSGFSGSRVDETELLELFKKLELSGRQQDLMVFGHLHPTGQKVVKGTRYIVEPSDSLLDPSMGSRESGGPVSGGDLAFIKLFIELNPKVKLPYVGIVADTREGAKLRIYKPKDLLELKKYSDIDKLAKRTITL